MDHLRPSDYILIASGIGSISAVVILFVRLTWWLSKEFGATRKLMYDMQEKMAERVTRLEYHAVRTSHFQPGLDPSDYMPLSSNGRHRRS